MVVIDRFHCTNKIVKRNVFLICVQTTRDIQMNLIIGIHGGYQWHCHRQQIKNKTSSTLFDVAMSIIFVVKAHDFGRLPLSWCDSLWNMRLEWEYPSNGCAWSKQLPKIGPYLVVLCNHPWNQFINNSGGQSAETLPIIILDMFASRSRWLSVIYYIVLTIWCDYEWSTITGSLSTSHRVNFPW